MEFSIKVNEKRMAQQVRRLAVMPNDPEFSFRLHTLGGENRLLQPVL